MEQPKNIHVFPPSLQQRDNDLYRETLRLIRNRLRKYSYTSVLAAFAERTDSKATSPQNMTLQLPWVADRIVLCLLRDNRRLYGHLPFPDREVDRCLNSAFSRMGNGLSAIASSPLELLIRSAILPQLPYQRGFDFDAFARQFDLAEKLPPDCRLRTYLQTTLGMPLFDFLELALYFWLKSSGTMFDLANNDHWPAVRRSFSNQVVDKFLARLMRPQESLRAELGEADADEWHQPALLYRTPFATVGKQEFFFGGFNLRRNLEHAFADSVAASTDSKVRQAFDKYLEAYVGESLRRVPGEVLDEANTRRRFSVEGKCCDYATIYGNDIVLLEVKNKWLSHDMPAVGSVNTYKTKLRETIIKSKTQLSNVATAIRQKPTYSSFQIWQVVVTSSDLVFGSPRILWEAASDEQVPVILSVDQLDRVLEASRLGHCTLASFLSDLAERNCNPSTKLFLPEMLLRVHPYAAGFHSAHLDPLYQKLAERLANRIGNENRRLGTIAAR
ncbi:hypothetical protein PCO31111_03955 [Pandoraea communis]|uniref:Uncharacterized protein n=1 Tax=Pandoraea communis TaxID=2508297 RepID=A0A5E4XKU3_9BURK|nr:hypothetical protein [Pandoraea communis]VVE36906.1 hypothetical protein PCO31111_03955 [Pandoraea communis]